METSSQAVDSVAQEAAGIEDIDIEDAGNPQLVVEYVQDIYNYLRYFKLASFSSYVPHDFRF